MFTCKPHDTQLASWSAHSKLGSGSCVLCSHQLSGWTLFWSSCNKRKKLFRSERLSQPTSGWLPSSAHPLATLHPRCPPEASYRWQNAMGSCRLGTRMPKCSISTGLRSVATTSYLRTIWNTGAQETGVSPAAPALRSSPAHSRGNAARGLPSRVPGAAGVQLTGDQRTFFSQRQMGDGQKGWSFSCPEATVQA